IATGTSLAESKRSSETSGTPTSTFSIFATTVESETIAAHKTFFEGVIPRRCTCSSKPSREPLSVARVGLETYNPLPRTERMAPYLISSSSARRTVIWLVLNWVHSSFWVGSLSPGFRLPAVDIAMIFSFIWACRGRVVFTSGLHGAGRDPFYQLPLEDDVD